MCADKTTFMKKQCMQKGCTVKYIQILSHYKINIRENIFMKEYWKCQKGKTFYWFYSW